MAETLLESTTGAIWRKMRARICYSAPRAVLLCDTIIGLQDNMRRSESLRTGLMECTDIDIIEICGLNEQCGSAPRPHGNKQQQCMRTMCYEKS
jgi:hypothetical protein